ncbi:hypothetical protein ACSSS7_000125 [Eimeria intestinalis]
MARGVLSAASSCAVITCMFLTLVKAQDTPSTQNVASPSSPNDPKSFQNTAFAPSQPSYSNTEGGADPPKDSMSLGEEENPPPRANDTSERPNAAPQDDSTSPGGDAGPQQNEGVPPQPGEGRMTMAASGAGASVNQAGTPDARGVSAGAVGAAAESALQKLTEFRPRHRKTVDGRLCAAAFVHEGQTYTDCTDARSPDGVTGREWCYVEVQLLGKGPKDWEPCSPPLNYSRQLRKKPRGNRQH